MDGTDPEAFFTETINNDKPEVKFKNLLKFKRSNREELQFLLKTLRNSKKLDHHLRLEALLTHQPTPDFLEH